MKLYSVISLILLGFSSLTLANPFGVSPIPNYSYVLNDVLWDDFTIPVCWEDTTVNAALQAEVEAAVHDTWERHSQVDFTGWGQCVNGVDSIRISIEDTGPHTIGLGTQLSTTQNGNSRMVLNFTYNSWGNDFCRSNVTFCTRAIAVHEFGHALGFAHEQLRPDTPDSCTAEKSGTPGNVIFTDWDLNSVMNYCNPTWNNNGELSPVDIATVQTFYGNVPTYFEPTRRLIVPEVIVGANRYRAILDFNNSANHFTLTAFTAPTASSQPASFNIFNNIILIPFLRVMNSDSQVTALYSASLIYDANRNAYVLNNAIQIHPTPRVGPHP